KAPSALGRHELAQELAQRRELGTREPLGEKPFSELDGTRRSQREEIVEHVVEAVASLDRIDDHARDRLAKLRAVVEAHLARRARGVDRLRRRDREALAAKRPQEVVEDAEHRYGAGSARRRI